MSDKISIHQATNTFAPAFAALESLGFTVWKERGDSYTLFCAENEQYWISALDIFALLGLVKMLELRGADWRATEIEGERYLAFLDLPPNTSLERTREG